MAAARELARYKLDLVGVQVVRRDKEGMVTAGDYNVLYGKGNENHELGTGFFVHQKIAKKNLFPGDDFRFLFHRENYSLLLLLCPLCLTFC
jgi:hypothetical protein